MNNEIKNGKDILMDFFENLESIPGVDKGIALTLKELYRDNKLTANNVSNALLNQREHAANDKN